MCKLYTNTMSHYTRDLSIYKFWFSVEWKQSPRDTKKNWKFRQHTLRVLHFEVFNMLICIIYHREEITTYGIYQTCKSHGTSPEQGIRH